ncbi:MAG: type II toxin-antitoxin system death-on-curing family toxin [Syntrophobacterales bacterium]|jgi:death-on-curing protein
MRYLSLVEILELHEAIIANTGGARGIRDVGALESAVNQPRLTFDQDDLYPDLVSKAASLCFSLVMNHPFVDGNKRIGHAAMETFLILNGSEIVADVDVQERLILDLAAGKLTRKELASWLNDHITSR